MKAKSRRRLLISSVAMLLVAMLALGTATFAWFTVKTGTTAEGIKVKTATQSSIVVSSIDSAWTNDLKYNYENLTMKPVSTADGKNWYYTVAAGPGAYTAATAPDTANFGSYEGTAACQQQTTHMFYNMLNVKNAGAKTSNAITITATVSETATNSGANYLRVALVPATSTTHFNDKDSTGDNRTSAEAASFPASKVYTTGTEAAYKPLTGISSSGAITEGSNFTPTGTASISEPVGTLAKNEAKYYMLLVWFEGQDTDCFDTNAGNELPSIKFTITEATS